MKKILMSILVAVSLFACSDIDINREPLPEPNINSHTMKLFDEYVALDTTKKVDMFDITQVAAINLMTLHDYGLTIDFNDFLEEGLIAIKEYAKKENVPITKKLELKILENLRNNNEIMKKLSDKYKERVEKERQIEF
ncbi:hypothetical protein [Oceanivirga salmonicida]|uniref:hypothetical protein n=1 Tax=Oceanivirga salmonicida TaxID=1769291 RepID=UPI0012E191A9|nr:hypothetical protein [Oceanivirga salmonicida]